MNKRTTKKALALSFVAMLMCCAMLIGTTYAWFTDSVTSGNNKIVAGNLDIEVTVDRDGVPVSLDDGNLTLFDVDLWEPGVVAYETLTISNVGNLALKYVMCLNVNGFNTTTDGHNLTEVIKVAMVEGTVDKAAGRTALIESIEDWAPITTTAYVDNEVLEVGSDDKAVTLVAYWEPTDHDNDYNLNNERQGDEALYIDFSVVVAATQATVESDSFDENYDEDAEIVLGMAAVTAAINQGAKDSNNAIAAGIVAAAAENGETITEEEAAKLIYFDDALQYDATTGEYVITLHFEKGSIDYVNVTYNAVKALIAEAAQEQAANVYSVQIANAPVRIVNGDASNLDTEGQWVETDLKTVMAGAGGLVGALEAAAEFGLPVEFVDMSGNTQVYRMFFDLNWNEAPIDSVNAAIEKGAEDANNELKDVAAGTIYFDDTLTQDGENEYSITIHFGAGSSDYINEAYNAVLDLIGDAVVAQASNISTIQIVNQEVHTIDDGVSKEDIKAFVEKDLKAVINAQGGLANALESGVEFGLPVYITDTEGTTNTYTMNFDVANFS